MYPVKLASGGKKEAICQTCGEAFAKKHLLLLHKVNKHSYKPLFKCDQCSTILDDRQTVERHMLHHQTPGKFPCQQCGMNFKMKGSLMRHIRYKHTHEKPYKCQYCDYSSVECGKMVVHERTHTGEMPYECKVCEKKFRSGPSLKRHSATHRQSKEFICQLCFNQFALLNTLKNHLLKIHMADSVHLENVVSSKKQGLTTGLIKYLNHIGYTNSQIHDTLHEVKFCLIKPEFSNYPQYFSNISELLASDPCANNLEDISSLKPVMSTEAVYQYNFVNASESDVRRQKTKPTEVDIATKSTMLLKQNECSSSVQVKSVDGRDSTDCVTSTTSLRSKPIGKAEEAMENARCVEDMCWKLDSNLTHRAKQLHMLKTGWFGKKPQVIQVLEDGTILVITQKYADFLPVFE